MSIKLVLSTEDLVKRKYPINIGSMEFPPTVGDIIFLSNTDFLIIHEVEESGKVWCRVPAFKLLLPLEYSLLEKETNDSNVELHPTLLDDLLEKINTSTYCKQDILDYLNTLDKTNFDECWGSDYELYSEALTDFITWKEAKNEGDYDGV